ncbi:MAG: hypothetical protein ACPG7F_05655 [Aggregatilineales bacterium]
MTHANPHLRDETKTLYQLLIAGTGFSQQTQFVESLPAETLIYQQNGLARQALMSIVARQLREKAGYIPDTHSGNSPEKCLSDATHPCNQTTMEHLFLMLRGYYREALTECLREITRTGQHVQAEAAIHLLQLGKHRNDLRPLIKSAVGERGLWLAAQMSQRKHNWIARTKTVHDDLASARHKEARLIRKLRRRKQKKEPILALQQHRYLWGEALATAFLETLSIHLERHYPHDELCVALIYMARYYPPDIADDLYEIMIAHPTTYPGWANAIEKIQRTLDFRRRMLNAIYESGDNYAE